MRGNGESVEETMYLDDVLKSEFAEEDLEPGFERLSACAEGGGGDGGVVEEDVEDEKLELEG